MQKNLEIIVGDTLESGTILTHFNTFSGHVRQAMGLILQ